MQEARLVAGDRRLFARFRRRAARERLPARLRASSSRTTLAERDQRYRKLRRLALHRRAERQGVGGRAARHAHRHVARRRQVRRPHAARAGRQGAHHPARAGATDAALTFLWRVRNELHFFSGHKNDVLRARRSSRASPRTSATRTTRRRLGVERFMRDYYLHARVDPPRVPPPDRALPGDAVAAGLGRAPPAPAGARRRARVLRRRAPSGRPRSRRPARRAGSAHEGLLAPAPARAASCRSTSSAPSRIRSDLVDERVPALAARCAISSSTSAARGAASRRRCREMHELGLLGRYLPEFGALTCLVQYDVYHKFSADQHSLLAVEHLEALAPGPVRGVRGRRAGVPRGGEARAAHARHAPARHRQGRGHGHVAKGIPLIRELDRAHRACRAEDGGAGRVPGRAPPDDVAHRPAPGHRRPEDHRATSRPPRAMPQRLRMLYLLTYADMRAVGPGVLTGWQATILHELYAGPSPASPAAAASGPAARSSPSGCASAVRRRAAPRRRCKAHLAMVSDRYLATTGVQRMAEHLRMLQRLDERAGRDRAVPPSRPRLVRPGGGHARPARALLADRRHARRAGDEHHVRPDPHARPTASPSTPSRSTTRPAKPSRRRRLGAGPWTRLRGVLTGEQTVDVLLERRRAAGRAARRRRAGPPKIIVDNQLSDDYTVRRGEVPRPASGLLYLITRTLAALGLDIASARIATEIDQAVDTFYVHDGQGRKIEDADALERVRDGARAGARPAALTMLGRYREHRARLERSRSGARSVRLHLRPNHLTLIGLGVSLLAAAAFVRRRGSATGGLLLIAGRSLRLLRRLARPRLGQVTPFGAFLDSVIDRYSDLVVLLAHRRAVRRRRPHARGALVAMAGLVGSMMVSYTKARAESIGVRVHRGLHGAPRADDLSDRRRSARSAGAGAMGAGGTVESHRHPAHRLHLARDARHRVAADAPRRRRAAGAGGRRGAVRGAGHRAAARAGVGGRRRGLPAGRRRAVDPRVLHRRGQKQRDRRSRPLPPGRGALARRRPGRRARRCAERRRSLPQEPSGAARALARRDARPARRTGCVRADAPGPPDQRVSRRARAARRALSARDDGRGARPARRARRSPTGSCGSSRRPAATPTEPAIGSSPCRPPASGWPR